MLAHPDHGHEAGREQDAADGPHRGAAGGSDAAGGHPAASASASLYLRLPVRLPPARTVARLRTPARLVERAAARFAVRLTVRLVARLTVLFLVARLAVRLVAALAVVLAFTLRLTGRLTVLFLVARLTVRLVAALAVVLRFVFTALFLARVLVERVLVAARALADRVFFAVERPRFVVLDLVFTGTNRSSNSGALNDGLDWARPLSGGTWMTIMLVRPADKTTERQKQPFCRPISRSKAPKTRRKRRPSTNTAIRRIVTCKGIRRVVDLAADCSGAAFALRVGRRGQRRELRE